MIFFHRWKLFHLIEVEATIYLEIRFCYIVSILSPLFSNSFFFFEAKNISVFVTDFHLKKDFFLKKQKRISSFIALDWPLCANRSKERKSTLKSALKRERENQFGLRGIKGANGTQIFFINYILNILQVQNNVALRLLGWPNFSSYREKNELFLLHLLYFSYNVNL